MKHLVPLAELNTFFELFAEALALFDTKTMAHLYHMPCTLLSDDNCNMFSEAVKLEGFFNRGASVYKQIGVARVKAEIWNRQIWTDKMMMVKVKWKYADHNGTEIYSCDYNYILKREKDQQLRIVMSVSVNEKERMEEWQHNTQKQ